MSGYILVENSRLFINGDVNIPQQMNLSGDSQLQLGGHLTSDDLIVGHSSQIVRMTGTERMALETMTIKGGEYRLGTDNIRGALGVENGTGLTWENEPGDFDVNLSVRIASGSSFIVDAQFVGAVSVIGGSYLEINNDIQWGLHVGSPDPNQMSVVHHNAGTVGGIVVVDSSADYIRTGGRIEAQMLSLYDGGVIEFWAGDSAGMMALSRGTIATVLQADGDVHGLDLTTLSFFDGGVIHVHFDATRMQGLDWGLRLEGDHVGVLNGHLANGRITSNWDEATIIYDVSKYGNYTYFGAVSAIPEPGTLVLTMVAAFGWGWRCRRRFS